MPSLTDTQTMLLAHAGQHKQGSFYPLPATLAGTVRADKAVTALIKRNLAEERQTSVAKLTCRTDGDLRYGVFVTAAGLAAIGIDDGGGEEASPPPPAEPAAVEPTPRITKASLVLGLLQRESGATLAELIEATGWLPHTTRAALTGLRKKGHAVERSKRDDATCYRIAGAA